ncbi:MAG: HEAT repeat domain-containing protein, partial [Candidatus Nanoarchaeia archaeon]
PKDDEEKIWYFIAKKKWDECVKFGELAVGSLIAALKDKSGDKDASNNVRKGAARALSKLGKPAVDTLIAALNDQNSDVRREAARALGLIGDVKAVPALVRTLTDWYAEMDSAKALDMLGWKPKSVEEEIHYLIAKRKESYLMDKRQRDLLRKRWSEVKDVLLKDVESGEYKLVENALYAFIGIGNEEIIPSLIDILNKKGDANMAEAYLNCGHDKLRSAASDWAKEHGYTIMYGGGTSPVWWGR